MGQYGGDSSAIYHRNSGTTTLKNCVVPTGGTVNDGGTITETATVTGDPKIVSVDVHGAKAAAAADVYMYIISSDTEAIAKTSSAIKVGLAVGTTVSGATVPAKDQLGKDRAKSGGVTIGSFEYPSSGGGGGVIEPVKPVLPTGTPSNITAALFVKETSSADAVAKIVKSGIPASSMIVSGDDLILKPDLAKSLGASAGLTSEFTSMPIFTALGGAGFVPGNVIAVGFRMDGAFFEGSLASKVAVLKILTATTAEKFVYTDKPAEFGDGKFTIMTDADGIYTGTIVATDKYKLIVFIKDGGKYDLDGKENSSVSDPAVVFAAPSGGGNIEGVRSGCNAAVSTPIWLLLMAAPLVFVRKRK